MAEAELDSRAYRRTGPETIKMQAKRVANGFYDRYLSGDAILDIGYRGEFPEAEPVTDKAIGIELDYPGYDGRTLPFPDLSQDAVFVSHCLEHIEDYRNAIADWFRVLKIGGYLLINVPHQHLYERKPTLPSRFNLDHKRLYTAESLLHEINEAISVSQYRIRTLRDNDEDFRYDIPPTIHAQGAYEIECVIQKIEEPAYGAYIRWESIAQYRGKMVAQIVRELVSARRRGAADEIEKLSRMLRASSLVPFYYLKRELADLPEREVRQTVIPFIETVPFDEEWYKRRYPRLSRVEDGNYHRHFIGIGYFDDMMGSQGDPMVGY